MKLKINNIIKSAVMGIAVLGGAIAMQSFTASVKKLATEEFRFYNKSTIPNNPDHSQYVYRSNSEMCDDEGPVCSEVWDIGTSTTPSEGEPLSNYSSPSYVGDAQPGSYNGN